jgi:hypothetical protein
MSEAIRRESRRLARQLRPRRPHLGPDSAYDALLDQRLSSLAAQVAELKSRVNGLIFVIVAAVLTDLVVRLATAGR